MTSPSSRLRDDLNGLTLWAALAPPEADGRNDDWRYYANNCQSILAELDREFADLEAKAQR